MVNDEITLADEQIIDGCHKHTLRMSAIDKDSIELILDDAEPVRLSRTMPIQAKDLYGALQFKRGAKYVLFGLDSYDPMDESVYKDFFSLIREIIIGINALEPGAISLSKDAHDES